MLVIDVARIPPEGLDVDASLKAGEIHVEGEDSFALEAGGRVTGHIEKGDGESVHLRGRLSARLGVECSRCLERFLLPVEQELDFFYLPHGTGVEEQEEDVELKDRDLVVGYYDRARIDLGETIREQLFLGLPMKRLCREECRGICSMCGQNRNLLACECVAEPEPSSPFAKLLGKGRIS
jgi:uncharacterized protein